MENKLEKMMSEIFSQSTIQKIKAGDYSTYGILAVMDMTLGGEDCTKETDEFEHIQNHFALTYEEINELI